MIEMIGKKDIGVGFLNIISWIGALTLDEVTKVFALLFTVASLIYVIYGVINRRLDYKIKKQQLEE